MNTTKTTHIDSLHAPKYQVIKLDGTPIPDNEPVFVLRGQDIFAANTIAFYYNSLVEGGYDINSAHMEHLIQHMIEFLNWPNRKRPD